MRNEEMRDKLNKIRTGQEKMNALEWFSMAHFRRMATLTGWSAEEIKKAIEERSNKPT